MTSFEVWQTSMKQATQLVHEFYTSPEQMQACTKFSQMMTETLRAGGNIFSCGNGGSHCDALHFAEELTGKYRKNRKALGALALGDAPHTTCTANDFGFEHIFARQLEGLGRSGDLLIAISTSGNSKNIVNVIQVAKQKGIKTVGLLGRDGGETRGLVDHAVIVPGTTADRIQEMHIKILHIGIEAMERELFPENYA